ncbi:MAG: hypothetical protein C0606_03770 [Hyphomicrobiales bacterium]|nr:MAG: hypothetical protein C0606_03770 [Hyphomicrobiales bacterium]
MGCGCAGRVQICALRLLIFAFARANGLFANVISAAPARSLRRGRTRAGVFLIRNIGTEMQVCVEQVLTFDRSLVEHEIMRLLQGRRIACLDRPCGLGFRLAFAWGRRGTDGLGNGRFVICGHIPAPELARFGGRRTPPGTDFAVRG